MGKMLVGVILLALPVWLLVGLHSASFLSIWSIVAGCFFFAEGWREYRV